MKMEWRRGRGRRGEDGIHPIPLPSPPPPTSLYSPLSIPPPPLLVITKATINAKCIQKGWSVLSDHEHDLAHALDFAYPEIKFDHNKFAMGKFTFATFTSPLPQSKQKANHFYPEIKFIITNSHGKLLF